MSDAVRVILLLGALTYALKAVGPLVLGNRTLPSAARRLIHLLPAALLAALVATSVGLDGQRFAPDARLVGLAAAALVLWRRGGFILTVVAAAVVTAAVRALA